MKLLYLVSVFPALTETFVHREISELVDMQFDCVIGQLRPLRGGPTAAGFENLLDKVVSQTWKLKYSVVGLIWAAANCPRGLARNIYTLRRVWSSPSSFLKLTYLIAVSAGLAYRLRKQPPDHVRAHHLHTEAVAAMFLANLLGVPYSLTCHTVKLYFPESLIQDAVARATFVVADTQQVSSFVQKFTLPPQEVVLIRNGVDVRSFDAPRLSGALDNHHILAVGRLDSKKGFHVLLNACSILRSRNIALRCTIVGDGVQRDRLREHVKGLSLADSVELVGNIPMCELRARYAEACMLVVPSIISPEGETDGLPTVIIEAMASGVPIVATRTAAIPEIVKDRVTGMLADPGEALQLADAIQEFLEKPELRASCAKAGRELVKRDYDLKTNLITLRQMLLRPAYDVPVRADIEKVRIQ